MNIIISSHGYAFILNPANGMFGWTESFLIIFLGMNFTCSAWAAQVEHFSAKKDYAVLVFDNRGTGNSELSQLVHEIIRKYLWGT
jgi:pimeloyl-ACP methyl ester carboxylesterase